jgi:hypothetical protein
MVFDAYKMSNLHIDPCGGDEGPSVLPEQGKPSTNSRSNVNPSMHVRRTAEMLNHVGDFPIATRPRPRRCLYQDSCTTTWPADRRLH